MFDSPTPAVVVGLPGTGSDAHFARRAFGPACAERGLELIAVEPDPRAVVESYFAALDAAAHRGPVLAAGISLGAAVAIEWASSRPDAAAGVLAALPAWTGPDSGGCPAAVSAASTAAALRADGLEEVVARMRAGSLAWLGDALDRSWRSQWPYLPEALEEAAAYKWPEPQRLETVTTPVAVIGALDDPVHPWPVAQEWARLIPDSVLTELTLDELGADPAIVGRLGLDALGRARR
ncbi:alpha/beta hydrolase [Nocardia cyriacigeorgica]|nr:alpha/beta hydrolase [Nocardia cyriacigeorgica]